MSWDTQLHAMYADTYKHKKVNSAFNITYKNVLSYTDLQKRNVATLFWANAGAHDEDCLKKSSKQNSVNFWHIFLPCVCQCSKIR